MKGPLSPNDIIRSGLCIGCGSCVASSGAAARMEFDDYGQLKPAGSRRWLQEPSEHFSRTCPFSPFAKDEDEIGKTLFAGAAHHPALGFMDGAYVGHVAEEDFRERGSSGGMVTWVASELLRKGLIDGVAHVIACKDPKASGRFFQYRIARNDAEIRAGAKSRYYPIELSEVLSLIRSVPGRYAVVGIPCFIKAIHLLRLQDPILHERIRFTLGLFCGHMKSARFVESFAWQMKVPMDEVQAVEYRHKDASRPANWYNVRLDLQDGTVVNRDWWHLVDGDWGAGFFMNDACNFCDDVVAETADISFGDAWVEPYSSDGRGTNVVVVRSALVHSLIRAAIEAGRLELKQVDAAFVEQTQAAGLRQRREGLAYRLSWVRRHVQPRKRVKADHKGIKKERRAIYRTRYKLTAWAHRVFRLARRLRQPALYIGWARIAAGIYHGIAYHQGNVKEMLTRFRQLGKGA